MKTMYASLAPGPEHWRLMVEAAAAIRECSRLDVKTGERVPLCPEHFKKNIKQFLLNCMAEVPYISSWRWAIDCLKRGWCKWAPFRYFKLVLFNPRKYKLIDIKPYVAELRRVRTFSWVMRTKGKAGAYTWANQHDFAFNDYTVEQRKAYRAAKQEAKEDTPAMYQHIRSAAIARLMEVAFEEVSLIELAAGGKVDLKKLFKGSLAEFEAERAMRKQLEEEKGWRGESPESLASTQGSGV